MTRYKELVDVWKQAKEQEKIYNILRLKAEEDLLQLLKDKIKPNKTNNFDEGLKIVTGTEGKWDGTLLNKAKLAFDNEAVAFLFSITWKPDNKMIESIKETDEDLYKAFLEPALTIKPKKPSFSIKGEK